MKYLVLNTYPAVAIPLEALAVSGKVLFLDSDYRSEANGKVYWPSTERRLQGEIIDSEVILPEKPKDEEPA